VSQWAIFDAYMEDYRKQIAGEELNKNAEKRKLLGIPNSSAEDKGKGPKEDDMVHSTKMNKALGVLERMANQNAEDEIFQDFKFWEDVSTILRRRNVQIAFELN
jgi:dynein intermediate chain 1, axonemal